MVGVEPGGGLLFEREAEIEVHALDDEVHCQARTMATRPASSARGGGVAARGKVGGGR